MPGYYPKHSDPLNGFISFRCRGETGIALTRLVVEKDLVAVGNLVTVNWAGNRVPAKILVLSGKYMLHPLCLEFVDA